MRESPQVTVRVPREPAVLSGHDVEVVRAAGSRDDGPWLSRSRPTVLGVLLMVCAAGFATAHAIGTPGMDATPGDAPPHVVAVSVRDITVQRVHRAQLRRAVEVTLANTGARALRVLGGDIRGTGLSWSADRPLEPGAQLAAVLADLSPCAGVVEGLDSSQATLNVDVVASDGERRLAIPLPLTFLRDHDADVRAMCGTPTVADSLWVALGGASDDVDRDLAVPAVLQNRSVKPVQLLSVSSTLVGTAAVLRTSGGAQVPMPHVVPGRSLGQLARDGSRLEPEDRSYVVAVTVEPGACGALRARGGETVTVAFHYGYANDQSEKAESFFALDLQTLVGRACA